MTVSGLIIVGTGNVGTGTAGPDGSVDQYLSTPGGTWAQILPTPVNTVSGPSWLATGVQDTGVGGNGKFFLFGNTDGSTLCASYDPATNAYAAVTSLPSGCWGAGLGLVLGRKAYCIGGQNNISRGSKKVFSYDMSQGNSGSYVTTYTDLPVGSTSAGGAVVGSTMFFGGGDDEGNTVVQSTWFSWDGASSSYTSLTAMPGALAAPASVALPNGIILLIGGYSDEVTEAATNVVYAYNTTGSTITIGSTSVLSHAWATLPNFPIATSFSHACMWNGAIWVVGGLLAEGTPNTELNVVYVSTDNGNSWTAQTNHNVQSIAGSALGVFPASGNALFFATD